MPANLHEFSAADIRKHRSAESCYVTLGSKVYNVSNFLVNHPGGMSLILNHAGTDLGDVLADAAIHRHSNAAYEILEEYHIGFVDSEVASKAVMDGWSKDQPMPERVYTDTDTRMEGEQIPGETERVKKYHEHRFLDLNKPLFPQLWYGGFTREFYLQEVHRPHYYKAGESAILFGNILEPLSKTEWYLVPLIWFPPVIYATITAAAGLGNNMMATAYWVIGLCLWTLIEYTIHRFLFHIDKYGFNLFIWVLR
ncbi:fatty acid alpha-hydroxylase [Aspergillus pseudoviridinutans]|uniref:Fatty acid alpha-hydroxylase n=1 Tax=Aspergillus pseudoviridinutans TaxID=1517512 RepID=A0A9P3ESJ2_9EURO|nr:fatty acid alpha-hydroxylase [Aspergillus pseudoviridinutans]GIJ86486.1 fatty acid alpha-hydroxylase [Aspergillus pseudoviridinutans]